MAKKINISVVNKNNNILIIHSLQNQMPVQMFVEVSPQHQSFVTGGNNETLKRIMQTTNTQICIPDRATDDEFNAKHRISISGAINNVYTARQNIIVSTGT